MRKLAAVLVVLVSWIAGFSVRAQNVTLNQGAVRGVAYEGMLHYISDYYEGRDAAMGYFRQEVNTTYWTGPWTQYLGANASIKLPKDWNLQWSGDQNEYGQSLVLYGSQLINVAIALDSKGNPNVLVTRYDLNEQKFIDCNPVAPLGYSNHNGGGWGVAAVVMDDQVYVFTRTFVLVSSDGKNYTQSTSPLADGLSNFEPLDAVTFYTADGSTKVLVAFQRPTSRVARRPTSSGTARPCPWMRARSGPSGLRAATISAARPCWGR